MILESKITPKSSLTSNLVRLEDSILYVVLNLLGEKVVDIEEHFRTLRSNLRETHQLVSEFMYLCRKPESSELLILRNSFKSYAS